MTQVGEGWCETPCAGFPSGERSGEGRWGPATKEHSFRFVRIQQEWRLDGYTPGD